MATFRFEIWSTSPGEDPSKEDPEWDTDQPYLRGDEDPAVLDSTVNFSGYEFSLGVYDSLTAIDVGCGKAFIEDWVKDGTNSRLFYLDEGKWRLVSNQ